MDFAHLLDYKDFKASDGRLDAFEARVGSKHRAFEGEAAAAPMETLQQEKEKLNEILKQYKAKDTFNADESALYWRAPHKRGLVKGKTSGGKKELERLKVLFCVNADGSE